MASREQNRSGNEAPEMYKKLNLHSVDTKTLTKAILEDNFFTSYRSDLPADDPFNLKLRQTYARHFKKRMLPSKPSAYLSIGGPGEGKTSSFKSGSKKFAELMGLNWVDMRNVQALNYKPEDTDYLYAQFEFAGETSNVLTAGASAVRQNAYDEDVVVKTLNGQLALLKQAKYGFFALDDVANASPSVMNALMPFIEEKGAQGHTFGQHIMIGATGNDSSIDGSHSNKIATPFLTRCKVVAVHDTLDFFIERSMQNYHDRIGTAGVTDFLRLNPHLLRDNYHEIAQGVGRKGSTGPFANSRTWDKLIESMRPYEHGYRQDAAIVRGENDARAEAIKEIADEMGLDSITPQERSSIEASIIEASKDRLKHVDKDTQRIIFNQIGNHAAGSAFQEFTLKRLEYNVLEMAEQMMRDGELSESNKKLFTQKYMHSNAEESNNFGHHWVGALAKEATVQLGEAMQQGDHKAISAVGEKLGAGLLAPVIKDNNEVIQLDNGQINRCLNWIMQGVIQGGYAPEKAYLSKTGQPVLNQAEVLKPLIIGVNKAPTANAVIGKSGEGKKMTRAGLIVDYLTHNVKASTSVDDIESRIAAFGKLNEVRKNTVGAMPAEQVQKVTEEIKPEAIHADQPAPEKAHENEFEPNLPEEAEADNRPATSITGFGF